MSEFKDEMLLGDGKWTCKGCPVQAEGHLGDGRAWYFRARGGEWYLTVADRGKEVDHMFAGHDAYGFDPWSGYMPAEKAAQIINGMIGVYDGARTPEEENSRKASIEAAAIGALTGETK